MLKGKISNQILIQWGIKSVVSETYNVKVSFPVTYNTIYTVLTTMSYAKAYTSDSGSPNVNSVVVRAGTINQTSVTGFYFCGMNPNLGPSYWLSIGY